MTAEHVSVPRDVLLKAIGDYLEQFYPDNPIHYDDMADHVHKAVLSRATPSDDWRVGFYERWNDYAKEIGYAGLAEALFDLGMRKGGVLPNGEMASEVQTSAPRVVADEDVGRAEQAVSQALGDAYDCTRVWEAWSYGTMSEDDFIEVRQQPERLNEIAMAVIESFATSLPAARVPNEIDLDDAPPGWSNSDAACYAAGWNACRQAMLSAAPSHNDAKEHGNG